MMFMWHSLLTTIVCGAILLALGVQFEINTAWAQSPTHPTADAGLGGPARTDPGAARLDDGPVRTKVSSYLNALYLWFLGFVGIAALFAFVVGGVTWMLSTTLTSTEKARRWIANGIWGIVLAATSYLLLYTINPDLIEHGFDINAVIDRAVRSGLQRPQPETPTFTPGPNVIPRKPSEGGVNTGIEG